MKSFDSKRADAIKKKNDVYSNAEKYKKLSEELNKTRSDVANSKKDIPDDLPYETNKQIETYYKEQERKLEREALDLANKIKDAEKEADESIKKMTDLGDELNKKGDNLGGLKDTPLVGEFLDKKGAELKDQAEQMFDLAEESREYSSKLADSRTLALKRPE